ncbi:MAG: hypothetical protein ACR2ND_03170 [Solirubrobacteraceae bacterium]
MSFGITDLVVPSAVVVASANGACGIYGAVRWYRVEQSRVFWLAVRAGQLLAFAFAVLAGVLWLSHKRPGNDLFYLYALLPVAIGLLAEQLRITSAEQVLASRELADAQAVGRLGEAEQRSVVVAILRREMGVMAAASLVVCFLALRAAGTF